MDEKINNARTKTQQADLLGIKTPKDYDWSNYSSKTCGSVGGAIGNTLTKNAVSGLELNSCEKDK